MTDDAPGNGPDDGATAPANERRLTHPSLPSLLPFLVDIQGTAQLLGVSRAFIEKLDLSGRLGPVAKRLGRRRLWVVEELRRWVETEMPRRDEWERLVQIDARRGAPGENKRSN